MKLLILLFMPFHHISMVTAETGCHSDRDKDHRPRQNCTAAGHSSVPAGFEPSTKVLLFPYNLFSRLIWSSFQIFPEIYEVDLTGNQVQEVTSTVSPVLPTLSVLRLTSNRLRELQDGAFTACPGLTELYLDNNILEALSDHTFSGLSLLEILDLSSNLIKVLPELLLHPLPAIETLLLENNKIKVMPDDWFINKVDIPYLYLSSNPWACFCSLGYLRGYLDDYELNVYVRDGPIINSNVMSVVCDSPRMLQGKSVISLESELCPLTSHSGPRGDGNEQSAATVQMTTTIAPTATPPPLMAPSTTPPTPMTPSKTHPPPTTPPPPMTPLTSPPPPMIPLTSPPPPMIPLTSPPPPMTPLTSPPPPMTPLTSPPPPMTPLTSPPPPMSPPATPPPMTPSTNLPPTTPPMTPPTTYAFTVPPWDTDDHRHAEVSQGRGVFCFWLFAVMFALCAATLACILATVARMFVWYSRAYRPLMLAMASKRRGGEGVRMLSKMEVSGGVTALYRSILYVHREEEEPNPVTMEVPGGGVMREGRGRRGERDIYRKTLHRVLRREEELEGWQDVVEECRIDGERKGGSSRKRYSVILREEREKEEGAQEELNWVVGGWEVTGGGGGGDPCSSWGEWLAQYVPSMPWGLTAPPEEEACH